MALYLSLVDKLALGESEENGYVLHIINQLNVTDTISKSTSCPLASLQADWHAVLRYCLVLELQAVVLLMHVCFK